MKLTKYYQTLKPSPKRGGYSDIRMWPCYIVLSATTLFFAQWLGLFWSFVLLGAPLFAISIYIVGVHKPQNAPIKSWKVYELIEWHNKEFEQRSRLLRRSMKIIEEMEENSKKVAIKNNLQFSKRYLAHISKQS